MLNNKNTVIQTIITMAIHLFIAETIITVKIILTNNGNTSQINLSLNVSKARAKRLTRCTKEPVKLLLKKL